MADLDKLRAQYVAARNAAQIGQDIDAVCENLTQISNYVKELGKVSTYYEAIKCDVFAGSIDNIIKLIKVSGLNHAHVQGFFGFTSPTKDKPSFNQIARGDAIIEKSIVDNTKTPSKKDNDIDDLIDDLVKNQKDDNKETPDPVPTAKDKEPDVPTAKDKEPVVPVAVEKDIDVVPTVDVANNGNGATKDKDGGFTPECLDDFIGQAHVVRRIKQEIAAAKKLGKKHIDNILLFGSRGLGKSTLMKLIAKELGVDFRFMDASSFNNDVASQRKLHKFFMNICDYGLPVVIAFDEIHAMPKQIQTALLTLLNDRVYSYMDNNGMTQNIPIKEFTFIGATTDADKVLSTIKDRCNNLTFYLKDYTREELAKIFKNKFGAYGLIVEENVLEDCINRCRSSIREVESFVNGLRTKAINAETFIINEAMVAEYFRERELDPIGLRTKDLEILDILSHDPVGIMAAETLAAKAHLDTSVYVSEFEPYLIKLGFINISNRGRGLSEKGKRYLSPEAYASEPKIVEVAKEAPIVATPTIKEEPIVTNEVKDESIIKEEPVVNDVSNEQTITIDVASQIIDSATENANSETEN